MQPAQVIGWGSAPASTEVLNAHFETYLDTTDDWIVERTGIRSRRMGGTTAGLAAVAGRQAIERAGVTTGSVDAIVLATCTPDTVLPACAAHIQDLLGTSGLAMDLNAACAGFTHALVTAFGLVAMGSRRVLVIGSEVLSRIVDPDDRSTAIIFADGAGALLIDAGHGPTALLGHDLGNDPSGRHLITSPPTGPVHMDGREVFRRAVRATVASAERAMANSGASADDIALVVPHQANLRILEAAAQRLGVERSRWVITVDHTGNTSAASIPVALAEAADAGRVKRGDLVLLVGFGAGMSWGSVVLRWDMEGRT